MSDDEDSNEDDSSQRESKGYCHFNETGHEDTFTVNIFGKDIVIAQSPSSRDLGHGAVVWDSAGQHTLLLSIHQCLYTHDLLSYSNICEVY